MHARCLVIAAALAAALLTPAAAPAAIVDETVYVPTVDGARVAVEIRRDDSFDAARQPIILTYSPYNTLSEDPGGTVAADGLAGTFVPAGYARAVADVIGTRNSTGCWDYGGPKEQQSGVDLVNALSRLPWSNGKVAMIGASYDGTTANMVAVRGTDVPGLAAIVPQAAINHWYGYAYQDGVRYAGNSSVPTDEGIDTPLGFDFGLVRTPPTKPDAASVMDLPTGRYNPCESVQHTQYGYDTTPDYDQFWRDRDYAKDASKVIVPALVTHGWQDYNVKQSEGLDFYEGLTNAPFKLLYMWQGPHGVPGGAYNGLLADFFAETLQGEDLGLENDQPVYTFGRSGKVPKPVTREDAWPVPGTHELSLSLGRVGATGVLAPLAAGASGELHRHRHDERGAGDQGRARAGGRLALLRERPAARRAADRRQPGARRADHRFDHARAAVADAARRRARRHGGRDHPRPPQPALPRRAGRGAAGAGRRGVPRAGPARPAGPDDRRRPPAGADRRRLEHGLGAARRAGRNHHHGAARRVAPAAAGRRVGAGQAPPAVGGLRA